MSAREEEDAKIVSAMGLSQNGYGHFIAPNGCEAEFCDDYFSGPDGFVALLEWHQRDARLVRLGTHDRLGEPRWWASIGLLPETEHLPVYGAGMIPAAALRAATLAWLDARESK